MMQTTVFHISNDQMAMDGICCLAWNIFNSKIGVEKSRQNTVSACFYLKLHQLCNRWDLKLKELSQRIKQKGAE